MRSTVCLSPLTADAVATPVDAERRSPLYSQHEALGAKLVPFGGWTMPLSYARGTVAEHMACRSAAAMFDVSHLGTVRVSGAGALDHLQATLTNDLAKIAPGRAQYTHLLDPDDASVVDDIIVWWVDDETFDVMPNASNTSRVIEALSADGVTAVDTTGKRAVIAVQGPTARSVLGGVFPEAAAVGRFRVAPVQLDGVAAMAAGTGYTGEDGVELAVPAEAAAAVWDRLLAAGVEPAGLGARDTLRLEAALPLHGHELGPGITSLHAGLGWVVSWKKPMGFRGRETLAKVREAGPDRVLRGLATEGRRPPRAEQDVLVDGEIVGTVTSGNFSPVLGHGIALALVNPGIEPGAGVGIDMRGTELPAAVVPTPFVTA